MSRLRLFGAGAFIALALSGCPVTDNYFIDNGQPSGKAGDIASGDASTGAQSSGGRDALSPGGKAAGGSTGAVGGSSTQAGTAATTGGVASAGTATGGTSDSAGAALGGAPDAGEAGDSAGGAPPMPCVPATERCNGHDDDCDDAIDELVCNSNQSGTQGCVGFVVALNPRHGYMLCTTKNRTYSEGKQACAGQDMRLAWLESAEENAQVTQKVASLTNETDILIGATDQVTEGYWFWDGGAQFWQGGVNGMVVNGQFEAWASTAPDNANNEDCGALTPKSGTWGDRSCYANYPYLCEEKN